MKKKTLSICLAASMLAVGIGFFSPAYVMADTLPDGIYVGDYNLGGLTEEEAGQKVQGLVNEMENQKITLVVDGQRLIRQLRIWVFIGATRKRFLRQHPPGRGGTY